VSRYPSPQELEVIYAQRAERVAELAKQEIITAQDLETIDRLGRCKVADTLWQKLNVEARSRLLTDQHHSVRSCAILAKENR